MVTSRGSTAHTGHWGESAAETVCMPMPAKCSRDAIPREAVSAAGRLEGATRSKRRKRVVEEDGREGGTARFFRVRKRAQERKQEAELCTTRIHEKKKE